MKCPVCGKEVTRVSGAELLGRHRQIDAVPWSARYSVMLMTFLLDANGRAHNTVGTSCFQGEMK
jgi:hypothetical protein